MSNDDKKLKLMTRVYEYAIAAMLIEAADMMHREKPTGQFPSPLIVEILQGAELRTKDQQVPEGCDPEEFDRELQKIWKAGFEGTILYEMERRFGGTNIR